MTRTGSIVAALGGGANGSPFTRAQVVLQGDDGRFRQADRWEGGRPAGPALAREDVEALVASMEAVWLPRPVPAEREVRAWTIGAGFGPRRRWVEQALAEGDGVLERFTVGAATVILVREDRVGFVRDELAERARTGARAAYLGGKYEDALQDATLAWLATRAITPEHVALLVEAHRKCGQVEKAEALREMERSSQGDAFNQHVERELEELRAGARSSAPWRMIRQLPAVLGLDEVSAWAEAA